MDKTKILKNIYYDVKNPGGYSSAIKLYKYAKLKIPDLNLNDVKLFLRGEITYSLHRQVKRKFKRNPVVVAHANEQWQADLMDMKEWSRTNNGFNYILTIIDIFSKKAYAVPVQKKQGQLVAKAFENIFKIVSPIYLQTDRGTEFKNEHVKKVLKKYNVAYFTSKNDAIKCSVVERLNSTLKNKIFRIATKRGTRKWIDVLPSVIEAYNKTYHRSIKMPPIEVNENNASVVFKNLYGFKSFRDYLKSKESMERKIPVGAKVRKAYDKKRFDRGYYPFFLIQSMK